MVVVLSSQRLNDASIHPSTEPAVSEPLCDSSVSVEPRPEERQRTRLDRSRLDSPLADNSNKLK